MSDIRRSQLAGSARDILPHTQFHEKLPGEPQLSHSIAAPLPSSPRGTTLQPLTRLRPEALVEHFRNTDAVMVPLYLARIEDLGRGDLVQVDCACHHVGLLTPEFLPRLGLSRQAKVLDLKSRVRCRGCGAKEGLSFR